jgi:hypothetical protein
LPKQNIDGSSIADDPICWPWGKSSGEHPLRSLQRQIERGDWNYTNPANRRQSPATQGRNRAKNNRKILKSLNRAAEMGRKKPVSKL